MNYITELTKRVMFKSNRPGATFTLLLAALFCHFGITLSDASVCADGDVTLHSTVGAGSAASSSRYSIVKVCVDDKWWLVASETWTEINTKIACRSLGHYASEDKVSHHSSVHQRVEMISEIKCRGDELDISECKIKIIKTPAYSENADDTNGSPAADFASGSGESSGYGDDEMSSVLWDGSGSGNAKVVDANSEIKIAAISCQEPVTVFPPCNGTDIELIPFAVSSQANNNYKSGIVRICDEGKWAVLCDSAASWTAAESSIACGQLGYSSKDSKALTVTMPHEHDNAILSGSIFNCEKKQTTELQSCKDKLVLTHISADSCHSAFVAVQCKDNSKLCKDGEMKYMSSSVSKSKVLDIVTIMICSKGSWKTACDRNWSFDDASVLCNSANYTPQGALAIQLSLLDARFYKLAKNANEKIDVSFKCKGTEKNLSNCPFIFSGSDCPADRISSALCSVGSYPVQNCTSGSLRLGGGDPRSALGHGDLQICINNIWGGVSFMSLLYNKMAVNVICRQLGFKVQGSNSAIVPSLEYSPMFFLKIRCQGNEANLSDCFELSETYDYIIEDIRNNYYGTKIECVKPTAVYDIQPLKHETVLNTLPHNHTVNYTCQVQGEFPINVTWFFVSDDGETEMQAILTEVLTTRANPFSILSVPDVNPSKSGHYICRASNGFGKDEKRASLSVSVAPVLKLTFAPKCGVVNRSSLISCTALGYPKPLVKLMKDGKTLLQSDSNNSSVVKSSSTDEGLYSCRLEYTINKTSISDGGVYTCEAAGQQGRYSSDYFDVWSYPEITIAPESQSLTIFRTDRPPTVSLRCGVSSNPRSVVQWFKVDTNCINTINQVLVVPNKIYDIAYTSNKSSSIESVLTIKPLSKDVSGTYICMGRNSLGSISETATVKVEIATPFTLTVAIVNTSLPIRVKDTVIISCRATSTAYRDGFDLHWEKDGVLVDHRSYNMSLENASGSLVTWKSFLLLSKVNSSSSGVYTCVTQDKGGAFPRGSASVVVKVEDPLVVLRLVKDSPRVEGSSMTSYISVNKPTGVTLLCSVDNNRTTQDCTSGVVTFTDLWCTSPYQQINFTVTAISQGDTVSLTRPFYTGTRQCAVNLINDGISVNGRIVTVEFVGVNNDKRGRRSRHSEPLEFACRIEKGPYRRCSSPWITTVSEAGVFQLKIRPMAAQCRGAKTILHHTFTVE